jgi:hypothetical protein
VGLLFPTRLCRLPCRAHGQTAWTGEEYRR